jgi:O-antigen/teichoic acid export membrane protein
MVPWVLLCFLTGPTLFLTPFWSLLEGCNQVSSLYAFRLSQVFFVSLSTWISILAGAGLWTTSIASLTSLLCSFYFIRKKYWFFFKTLFNSKPTGAVINWRSDVLPLQWRVTLTWISAYFVNNFVIPVLFKYQGPVIAGQMGMTWGVMNIVTSFPSSWLSPAFPRFGILIAQKKYTEFKQYFKKIAKIFAFVLIVGALGTWFIIYLLNFLNLSLGKRFLPPSIAGIFMLSIIFGTILAPASYYVRAQKKEPYVFLTLVQSAFIGTFSYIFGKYYSTTAVAYVFLINSMIISFPWNLFIWYRFRLPNKGIGDYE